MNRATESENVIVNARCTRNGGLFEIKFEFRNGIWEAINSIIIMEKPHVVTAPRIPTFHPTTQILPTEIRGTISIGSDYPGCPYCRNRSFFLCGCGRLCCYDGVDRYGYCQWCHTRGRLAGKIKSLKGDVQQRWTEIPFNSASPTLQLAPPRVRNTLP
jgi:hypothetical protein